ncbi:biotin/lipoyl-binding protein [Arthrobacter sp. MSA 4-2]|uniref:acetyl/propionyl/methylcrotonyl-CoA carboxylase subunit alpha n=1 Tax=Arthrobacter sp. MSA 4-2 TaxID=2794349 RepID=UPI0018E78E21|nr:biotin carboxylase N-terminal domain-containing protein [Arthrobacter sp. MSA 4-2]MBJ2121233.1 biotin/lipoyl-binding protein [Arthrobacter sp. MSA 4-2]
MTAPHQPPFSTVLVANRGEIACRVIRTLRSLGIRSVAVYSDADAGARHVREADTAVRIGPASAAESYLSAEAILAACRRTGAEAVHPGYGFLSENAGFARALAEEGIVFIGPDVHALNVMGDKIRSKNHVAGHGVPVVPGLAEPGLTDEQLIEAAGDIGYPLLIKPSAGGGGKGMHAVYEPAELPAVLLTARRVAASAFGDDTLFLERLIPTPRHIEVQVLADQHGNVIHLGERECSLQRRHQKVIEEAPSALLTEATRARIGEAACNAARSVDYTGAGTVEFLVSDASPDEFFFMEMNTRLQVEHPVTELVTGVDLVEWQVRIAGGEALAFGQDDVVLTGHAVEARVYAENPEAGFLPSSGTVLRLEEPAGEGIRVDSSLLPGLTIPAAYDPMLSKVIAWGADRTEALDRLDTALASSVVLGIDTNTEYLRLLIGDEDVRAARLDTTLIERKLPGLAFRTVTDAELAVLAVGMLTSDPQGDGSGSSPAAAAELPPWQRRDGFRLGVPQPRRLSLEVGPDDVREVSILPADSAGPDGTFAVAVDGGPTHTVRLDPAGGAVVDGVRTGVAMVHADGVSWLGEDGWSVSVRRLSRSARLQAQLALVARAAGNADPLVRSPMPGTVVSVSVSDGDAVEEGQVLLAVEAMKMEHQLRAAVAGTVHLTLKPGDLVRADQVVASIHVEEAVPAGDSAGQDAADQETAGQETAAQEPTAQQTAAQEPTAKEVSAR